MTTSDVTPCDPPTMAIQWNGYTVAIPPMMHHPGLSRVDLIAYEGRPGGNPRLVAIHGVPAMQPVAPEPVQNLSVIQVEMARVTVRSNTTRITADDISNLSDHRVAVLLSEMQRSGARP
jgi:hypothetical protein